MFELLGVMLLALLLFFCLCNSFLSSSHLRLVFLLMGCMVQRGNSFSHSLLSVTAHFTSTARQILNSNSICPTQSHANTIPIPHHIYPPTLIHEPTHPSNLCTRTHTHTLASTFPKFQGNTYIYIYSNRQFLFYFCIYIHIPLCVQACLL